MNAARKPARKAASKPRRVATGQDSGLPVGRVAASAGQGGEQRALPAAGDTAPATRTSTANLGTVLTLPEAAQRLGWSLKTAYRRVRAGDLDGAHKLPAANGEQWVVPVATVERLASVQAAQRASANPDAVRVAELLQQVAALEAQLATERAVGQERVRTIEQLTSTVRALTAASESLAASAEQQRQVLAAVQALAARPRWWQRRPDSGA